MVAVVVALVGVDRNKLAAAVAEEMLETVVDVDEVGHHSIRKWAWAVAVLLEPVRRRRLDDAQEGWDEQHSCLLPLLGVMLEADTQRQPATNLE